MITNLELKLNGQEPVTRDELLELVSSWGRKNWFIIEDKRINKCEPSECYPLENIDISKIQNLACMFYQSNYDGDLSKWNVSKVTNMNHLFGLSKFNNNSISNWDVSNVINMRFIFSGTNFNKDISNWNFNSNVDVSYFVYKNEYFIRKYNNGNLISDNSQNFKLWFEENRDKIRDINISKEEVLDFFSFDSNLNKDINND